MAYWENLKMLPIHKIIWHEARTANRPERIPERSEAMEDTDQIKSYLKAYEWGGPFSALQLYHLRALSKMIRPRDIVLDLACGPGPLLLELAQLYPRCTFIGVDLSAPMLGVLRDSAAARSIKNIEILHEDIRDLPSLNNRKIDLVITTLALHHLPDFEGLRQTFKRFNDLLVPDGGFYVFDFGLLRSSRTRALLLAESAKTAPPITVIDQDQSLQAAFVIDDVVRLARACLRSPFSASSSSFVDYFYFLQTAARTNPAESVKKYISSLWDELSPSNKIEYLMLKLLRRKR
ncbi:MAG: class I SAM-dependent methyltransferase [Cryobacterium sp.]|nr:class I SAM-dependent methyltransferase [Cryobacterium sp.]